MGMDKIFKAYIILDLIDKITSPMSNIKKSIRTFNDSIPVLSKLGTKMSVMGGALTFAGIGFLKTSNEAYQAGRMIDNVLTRSMQNAEIYTAKNIAGMDEFANSIKRVTNFDDDDIKRIASGFARARLPMDQLKKATVGYFDMMAAGVEPTTLSRALEEPLEMAGSMRRIGVFLNTDLMKTMTLEKQRSYIIDMIGKKYAGMAQVTARADLQFRNNVGEIKKTLGSIFEPFTNGVYKALNNAAIKVNDFLKKVADFSKKHPVIIKIIGTLIFGLLGLITVLGITLVLYSSWSKITNSLAINKTILSKSLNLLTRDIWKNVAATKVWQTVSGGFKSGGLTGGILGLTKAFGGLAMSVIRSSLAFLTSPIGLIIIAVTLLGLYIYNVVKNWDKYKKTFTNMFSGVLKQFDRLKNNVKGLLNFFKPVSDWLQKIFNFKWKMSGLDALAVVLGTIIGFFEWIYGTFLNNFGETFLGGINDIIEGLKALFNGDIVNGFAKIFGGIFKVLSAPMIGLINTIVDVLNTAIKLTGMKFEIPRLPTEIPQFANGINNFGGGLAYVHQDELLDLPRGTSVISKSKSKNLLEGINNGRETVIKYFNVHKVEINPEDISQLKNIVDMFSVIEREADYAT